MRLTDELDRLVLRAVSEDFVPLEFIIEKLDRPGSRMIGRLNPDLVHARLQELTADKLIKACLLHADPPYITPVKASPESLPTCWFYITQRGMKCLANSSRRRAELESKCSASRRPDEYNRAVNF